MMFLVAKIFIYLLLALGLGAAAGWLWRNLQAVTREVALERQLIETRGRMPQLESAMRSREQQLQTALADLKARDEAIAEQQAAVAERDRLAAELARTAEDLRRRRDAESAAPAAAGEDQELTLHPGNPGEDAEPSAAEGTGLTAAAALRVESAASAEPSPSVAEAQAAARSAELAAAHAAERDALQQQLGETTAELERVRKSLTTEQRRVEELTRERELQNLSLRALEQQLEIARETPDRAASA